MIFSDETGFTLSADDYRTHAWRQKTQLSNLSFAVITQSVTVWEANCWDTLSPIVVPQISDAWTVAVVLPMISSYQSTIYQQDDTGPQN